MVCYGVVVRYGIRYERAKTFFAASSSIRPLKVSSQGIPLEYMTENVSWISMKVLNEGVLEWF